MIVLKEEIFDEKEQLIELWESSTDAMLPNTFPHDVRRRTNQYTGNPDDRRYLQTIYLESDDEIGFTAQAKTDHDRCVGFDDLDLVDTIDGDDYYFYDYRNKDVEAAVSIDDMCYSFEAEEYSEDEMLEIAQSLKPIDEPVHDISLEDLKFPTKFPSEKPEPTSPRVISYSNGEKVDFLMDYRSDRDDRKDSDIHIKFEIRTHEPNLFGNKDEEYAVDVDDFDEA